MQFEQKTAKDAMKIPRQFRISKEFLMRVLQTFLLLVTTFSSLAVADEGDDTLRMYLAKSPLVVVGKIVENPFSIRYEAGVLNHLCTVAVTEVLQGDSKLKNESLKVRIVRFELGSDDRHPLIRKDAECILFLKPTLNTPSWETADVWFGIQHSSPLMAKSLARLSEEQQKRKPAK